MNEENKNSPNKPSLAEIVNARTAAPAAPRPQSPGVRQTPEVRQTPGAPRMQQPPTAQPQSTAQPQPAARSQPRAQAQTQPRRDAAPTAIAARDKKARKKHKEHSERTDLIRKRATLVAFALFSLVALVVCTQVAYSYSGDSIRLISNSGSAARTTTRDYRIVYSESDAWGLAAATALRDAFSEKTGATLTIMPDSEAAVLHEIRIGHTNRASDDYITSLSTLGENGYAVMLTSDDSVNIIALGESGAMSVAKYFVANYVGSYRYGKLTLSAHHSFTYVDRTGNEPLSSIMSTKLPLTFSADGSFRVLVLSDADVNEYTIRAIGAMSEAEKVDLVIFAGDVSAGIETRSALEEYVKKLTLPLEESGTPWAVLLGEQDTDGGLDAIAQAEVYASFEHCVSKLEMSEDGAVSCFLPIYPHGDITSASVPAYGVWLLGQTAMLSEYEGAYDDALLAIYKDTGTDYGIVPMSHIAFFTETGALLDRAVGGSLGSIVVTHTPLSEFSLIAANQSKAGFAGEMGESISASPINSGLFAAALSRGSVGGIYVGHDHLNSFSGRYCGIELGYSASIGYDGYGFGGTFAINNRLRGGRLIELRTSEDGVSLESRMIYAENYGIDGEGD